jgi:hypothetical protein
VCLDERAQNSPKFASFLQLKKEELAMDISSLLIQPVQRIPRYRLLFAELLKYTPESHVDHVLCTKTLLAIEEVAKCVNESVREKENQEKLLQIQQSLIGSKLPVCFYLTQIERVCFFFDF